ncbi:hypothetical protein BP6252_05986 [Coleophoma cylindrospora]|uniref:Efflux pump antibiotic resistance protein n=1 Tax=Coleophoma cylindrospora TaxID=1849047 RepID=A0A3D8RLS3_9HELO|nr:hypothetical protein BP6252_05986 [Coleophoma cylindrospora]
MTSTVSPSADPPPSTSENGGLKVINASLFRMATKSMAQAYIMLGYKTHHALLEDMTDTPWAKIEEAAEATWPTVPGARPRPPFTRADWDDLWGTEYDAVTDISSPFVLELIKAYPDAKVVVVQRDFDSWWASFYSQVFNLNMTQPIAAINGWICWRIMGVRAVHAMRKIMFGFFDGKSKAECEAHAREKYDSYFREIRKLVPPERRLEYKVGSGWEPLCTFLGKEVPNVDFPRANDRAAHQEETKSRLAKVWGSLVKVGLPWAVGVTVVGAAVFYARR